MKSFQYLIPFLLFSLIVCKAEMPALQPDSLRAGDKTEMVEACEQKIAVLQAEMEKKQAIATEEKKKSQTVIYLLTGISLLGFVLAFVGFRKTARR